MSGRLILLPKKSYTPWNTQTTEQVLRDERLAYESQQRLERNRKRNERLDWIRKSVRDRQGDGDGDGDGKGEVELADGGEVGDGSGRNGDERGEELWPNPTITTTNTTLQEHPHQQEQRHSRGGNGILPVFLTDAGNNKRKQHDHQKTTNQTRRRRRNKHSNQRNITHTQWNVNDIHGGTNVLRTVVGTTGNDNDGKPSGTMETETETDQRRKSKLDPMAPFVSTLPTNDDGIDPIHTNGGISSKNRSHIPIHQTNERSISNSKSTQHSERKRQRRRRSREESNNHDDDSSSSSSSSSRNSSPHHHRRRHHHHRRRRHRTHHRTKQHQQQHRHSSKRTTSNHHKSSTESTSHDRKRKNEQSSSSSSSSKLSKLQEMERRLCLREKEEMEREQRVRDNGGGCIRRWC